MHPARASHSPTGVRNPPQRRLTPSNDPLPSTAPHHSQTSLPSIRQLHPYLPPSGMSQHLSATGEGSSSYSYPAPPHYASHPGQQDQPASHLSVPPREMEGYGGIDSEAEDLDQHGPPKKKRRRQALSCTGNDSSFVPHVSMMY
jgi:hypothetical protein